MVPLEFDSNHQGQYRGSYRDCRAYLGTVAIKCISSTEGQYSSPKPIYVSPHHFVLRATALYQKDYAQPLKSNSFYKCRADNVLSVHSLMFGSCAPRTNKVVPICLSHCALLQALPTLLPARGRHIEKAQQQCTHHPHQGVRGSPHLHPDLSHSRMQTDFFEVST